MGTFGHATLIDRCGTNEDVERYVQGAEAREAQRQIEAVKIDDLPTRQEMMKRQSDRIWRAEITYKEVTSQDQTKSHSQGMKR